MLGPETGRNQRPENDRGNGVFGPDRRRGALGLDPRLRKSLPFVAAFVAGFLLGRQDGGDVPDELTRGERGDASESERTAATEERDVMEAVARVRQRMAAVGTAMMPSGTDATPSGTDPTPSRTEGAADDGEDTTMVERARIAGREGTEIEAVTDEVTSAEETEEIDTPVGDLSAPTIRGMPMLGVGTAEDWDYDECLDSIRTALQLGYRHVDATERREAYHNETPVGEAIEATDVPREEVFVATKVSPADLDYEHVLTSADQSLDRLGMDYVDLLYVHWPTGEYDPEETLEAFAQLREEGRVEEIGVSNFTVELLEEAMEVSPEPIFANQVEMHPLLPQEGLRRFCARDGVDVELVAYSPIARGDVEDVQALQEVAAKHEITPEQVSLAWLREKGVTAIPEATTEDHLRENWLSLDVDLDDEDVEKLDSIEERRRIVDPDEAPWNR